MELSQTVTYALINASIVALLTLLVFGLRRDMRELRTELRELRIEVRGKIAELRTELRTDTGRLDDKIDALRSDLTHLAWERRDDRPAAGEG